MSEPNASVIAELYTYICEHIRRVRQMLSGRHIVLESGKKRDDYELYVRIDYSASPNENAFDIQIIAKKDYDVKQAIDDVKHLIDVAEKLVSSYVQT